LDTPDLPFAWGNARCQPLPLGWFFPDTEAVTKAVAGLTLAVMTCYTLMLKVDLWPRDAGTQDVRSTLGCVFIKVSLHTTGEPPGRLSRDFLLP
jgi:hypothetical protein